MKILRAVSSDAQGIAYAHVSAWQTAYRGIVADDFLDQLSVLERTTRWAEILDDPDCQVLVAKDGETILGFLSFGESREVGATTADGEIWTMYVNPGSWRKRIGQALMTEALAILQVQGCTTVCVWVLQANTQAIAFYSSSGFVLQPASCRAFQLSGQKLAEVALVRHVA